MISRLGYLAIRNSLYKIIYDQVKPAKKSNDLTIREKMVLSGFVGGVAAYVTSPFTLISIRQILDTQTKQEWRRNYVSTSEAIELIKKEGAMWKGSWQNVLRHVALNASLTGPYDYVREGLWTTFGDYYFVQPVALLSAAAVSAAVTLPFDNVRTRFMQSHPQAERNRMNYAGTFDAMIKAFTVEGSKFSLWAGYTHHYLSTLIYAGLTIGITELFVDSWKRKAGLEE